MSLQNDMGFLDRSPELNSSVLVKMKIYNIKKKSDDSGFPTRACGMQLRWKKRFPDPKGC